MTSIVLSIAVPLSLTIIFVSSLGIIIMRRRLEKERLEKLKREAEIMSERARQSENLPRLEEMIREARGDPLE